MTSIRKSWMTPVVMAIAALALWLTAPKWSVRRWEADTAREARDPTSPIHARLPPNHGAFGLELGIDGDAGPEAAFDDPAKRSPHVELAHARVAWEHLARRHLAAAGCAGGPELRDVLVLLRRADALPAEGDEVRYDAVRIEDVRQPEQMAPSAQTSGCLDRILGAPLVLSAEAAESFGDAVELHVRVPLADAEG